ncbi:vomeronasal type-2 receptor 26-like [Pyxicephalus adspersus]|uniref:vomeronasal type-2 receptor 26-like n=1 Tax=Pyxicephalus adspersus TaxID=30357 RepID=UPI003B5A95C5
MVPRGGREVARFLRVSFALGQLTNSHLTRPMTTPLNYSWKPCPLGHSFNLAGPEIKAQKENIQENLEKGFICPSSSPAGAGFFFVGKKDGGLRPCIDYRGLNKLTVRNPLPQWKTFSLRTQVHQVLQKHRENCLFAKLEKCTLEVLEVAFLGYILLDQGLAIDPNKVSAVLEWPEPTDLKGLQLFLGFANFYRKFIWNFSTIVHTVTNPTRREVDSSRVDCREYVHLLAFLFAINEINSNPDILPNVTLGYHIYDSCGDVKKATKDVLQILSGHTKEAPNYSCMQRDNVAGFIGDLRSDTTLQMAQLLNLYGYTQISYGAGDSLLSDRRMYPNVFRTVPDNEIHYMAIVKLLERLKWNWIGIITSDDEYGEREIRQLSKHLTNHRICIEFKILVSVKNYNTIPPELKTSTTEVLPKGRCSSECLPGFRKALREGYHICCYDCVPCSEGEMSNQSDSENCQMCPENEWPNNAKNICVSKTVEYLSYEKDVLVIFFSVFSILFAATSYLTLGIFFWFWSTPLVKANNRNLSFILLCSLTLSFLSVFLFLGRPVDITCMLQQISFGIVFTISVSSILARTIMVSIAFKATRPGSSCRKWVGVKLPNTVMLFCPSIQVINGILWLSISPPFQEYDMHSYPGEIIIQCNDGSTLAFYITLGYMGFLAAVSFVLAFMVRTLPDSFNEAKYITFSMLVFCSVWIAMIPAYLSTRGKYMVAVEIFAILTSSAGVLFCIFFPKLYILLFKAELNTQKNILGK